MAARSSKSLVLALYPKRLIRFGSVTPIVDSSKFTNQLDENMSVFSELYLVSVIVIGV